MSRNKRQKSGDAGFALPLALTVLVLLSYVIASGLQRVRVAQADIRLSQANVRADILQQNLEEDVVWRTLLEVMGRKVGFEPMREESRYKARAPESPWRRDGSPFLWSPNYPDMLRNRIYPALIIVQDEVGKIDLNRRNKNYLTFIAERIGIPSTQRVTAANILLEYIESKTPSPIDIENALVMPMRTGLQDAYELCTLDIWRDTETCADPERLRALFTGGVGLLPNINYSSSEIIDFLFAGDSPESLTRRSAVWSDIQVEFGFYDLIGDIGDGGLKLSITIIPAGAEMALCFDVDPRGPSNSRPFSVKLRRQVASNPILTRLEESAPDVVASFRAYSSVSEVN